MILNEITRIKRMEQNILTFLILYSLKLREDSDIIEFFVHCVITYLSYDIVALRVTEKMIHY